MTLKIDLAQDIQPLSTFKRDAAKLLDRMEETGRPLVLTRNGKAAAVALDVAVYQELVAAADRLDSIRKLQAAFADIENGRVTPFDEAIADIRRELNVPDPADAGGEG